MKITRLAALALVLVSFDVRGQALPDIGRPFQYSFFKPLASDAHPQNWSVVQGLDGRIFVGNGNGILVYDGVQWDLITTDNKSVVRSLAISDDGRIYVGASGEFGVLVPSRDGTISYSSLSHLVSVDFDDVWHTIVIDRAIYFVSGQYIFRFDQEEIQLIKSETGFHTAFTVNDRLFVREKGVGLIEIRGTTRLQLSYGSYFRDERVYSLISSAEGPGMIAASRESGLWFLEEGREPRRISDDASAYLVRHEVYKGRRLRSGVIAYATLGGGVIFVDGHGRIIDVMSDEWGVGVVNYLYEDHDGAIWIALDNGGLVRARLGSALSVIDEEEGLDGVVYHLGVASDRLYVSSGSGLFSIPNSAQKKHGVHRVENIRLPKGICVTGDSVVVASENGLFLVRDGLVQESVSMPNAHAVAEVGRGSFLIGHGSGLSIFTPGDNANLRALESDVGDVRDLRRESDGTFLIVNRSAEVFRGILSGGEIATSKVHYRGEQPVGRVQFSRSQPPSLIVDGELFSFVSDASGTQYLEPSHVVEDLGKDYDRIVSVVDDNAGVTWVITQDHAFRVSESESDQRKVVEDQALSFERSSVGAAAFDGPVGWFSSGRVLYRYDTRLGEPTANERPPIIRNVATIGSFDIVFGGHTSPETAPPKLDYVDNDIQFNYSAPIYYAQEHIRYQVKLSGRDTEWTDWTASTVAEYTNLREGDYSFQVRARNIFGLVSPESSFSFTILPPWYRTWWAYFLYVAGCATLAGLSVRYYRMTIAHRKAKEQEKELQAERLINERLQHANERLKTANNRLVEVNALKDEFLATTSHELRTPITAIQGYATILREELDGPQREFAEIIDKSSQRLMRTLNSVLDLAKLRSGTIDVNPVATSLPAFVEETLDSIAETAAAKGLTVVMDAPDRSVEAEVDQYLLRNALLNILDNAIKFSERGTITVSISESDHWGTVSVRDEGIGIDPDFLPRIFDEFKQESGGLAREHGGTGLGLAIASLMVKAMGGDISVQSVKNEGTTATISVPIVRASGSTAPIQSRAADRDPVQNRPDSGLAGAIGNRGSLTTTTRHAGPDQHPPQNVPGGN